MMALCIKTCIIMEAGTTFPLKFFFPRVYIYKKMLKNINSYGGYMYKTFIMEAVTTCQS